MGQLMCMESVTCLSDSPGMEDKGLDATYTWAPDTYTPTLAAAPAVPTSTPSPGPALSEGESLATCGKLRGPVAGPL